MSSPQLEDGHTQIANELLEAILGSDLTGKQVRVVMAIIRKTYGFKKKIDDMSASQIGMVCNLQRNHVTSCLNQLLAMNVITKTAGKYGSVTGINKAYKTWVFDSPKNVLVQKLDSPEIGLMIVQKLDCSIVPKLDTQKKTLQKKTSKEITFSQFRDNCKATGEQAISDTDPVLQFIDAAKIPWELIELNWELFNDYYLNGAGALKKYIDWRIVYRKTVKEGWYKLWAVYDGDVVATQKAKMLIKGMQ